MIPLLHEQAIPAYVVHSPEYAYNLRCRYCRKKRAHAEAQHAKAVTLWAPGDGK